MQLYDVILSLMLNTLFYEEPVHFPVFVSVLFQYGNFTSCVIVIGIIYCKKGGVYPFYSR